MEFWKPETPEMGCWEEEGDQEIGPAVMAVTTAPVRLEVSEVGGVYTPVGSVSMGTFLNGRLIARSWVEPGVIGILDEVGLFRDEVGLALIGWETSEGFQGRLFAVIESEPESAKAESAGAGMALERGDNPMMIPLGTHFRRDRTYPNDLGHEALDLLGSLLQGRDTRTDVIDRLLEDLVR